MPGYGAFPWQGLAARVGCKFHTLDRGNWFTLNRVESWGVYYARDAGSVGYVRPLVFDRAWALLASGGEVTLPVLGAIIADVNRDASETDQSCVAALVASAGGIRYLTGPIRLRLRGEGVGRTFRPECP